MLCYRIERHNLPIGYGVRPHIFSTLFCEFALSLFQSLSTVATTSQLFAAPLRSQLFSMVAPLSSSSQAFSFLPTPAHLFFQQRELMGSSAQKSSGVHWCRRRVRFNEVPGKVGKVPKVPEKVWEALVQSQVTFNRVPEKVPQKVWEALVQSPVRFNRVPEKVPGSLGGKPSQVQQGSGEGSGEALLQSQVTGFRRRFRRRFERLWCRARSGSTGFRRRFQ